MENPFFLVNIFPGDLTGNLRIPDSFLDQHGEYLSKKLTLIPRYGKPQTVSVKRDGKQECCFFTRGWGAFVEDNGVEDDDFVVFNFRGDGTVNVGVCDSSGCSKGVTVKDGSKGKRVKRANREIHSPSSSSSTAADASYEVIFRKYMKNYMYMPLEFSETAQLSVGESVSVQDPSGLVRSIRIVAGGGRQMRLSAGWQELVMANGLEVGDRVGFSFKAGAGIKMKVID